jgi:hypothetical protein
MQIKNLFQRVLAITLLSAFSMNSAQGSKLNPLNSFTSDSSSSSSSTPSNSSETIDEEPKGKAEEKEREHEQAQEVLQETPSSNSSSTPSLPLTSEPVILPSIIPTLTLTVENPKDKAEDKALSPDGSESKAPKKQNTKFSKNLETLLVHGPQQPKSDAPTPSGSDAPDNSTLSPSATKEKEQDPEIRFNPEDLQLSRVTQARKRAEQKKEQENLARSFTPGESTEINEKSQRAKELLQRSKNHLRFETKKKAQVAIQTRTQANQTIIAENDDDFQTPEDVAQKLEQELTTLETEAAQLAATPQEKKEGIDTLQAKRKALEEKISQLPQTVATQKSELLTRLNSSVAQNISLARSSFEQTKRERGTRIQDETKANSAPKTKKVKITQAPAIKAKKAPLATLVPAPDIPSAPEQPTNISKDDEIVTPDTTQQQNTEEPTIENIITEQDQNITDEHVENQGQTPPTDVNQNQNQNQNKDDSSFLNVKTGILSIVAITALLGIGYKLKQCYDLYQILKAKELENPSGTNDKELLILAAKESLLPEYVIQWLEKRAQAEAEAENPVADANKEKKEESTEKEA